MARTPSPSMFEPRYDRVYGSAIFGWSKPVIQRLRDAFPDAIVGGTGIDDWTTTVEAQIGEEYEHYDYSIYPEYEWSLGFTQRGCRLNCGFCVVPKKEGRPRSLNTIWDIWRPDTPRNICLLDNDFFGQGKSEWSARLAEIKEGGFKVCFNIRLINEESAIELASVPYYDDQFKTRRLYTAWDNLGQEGIFFKGVNLLKDAGVPPSHLMVYMLIGYAPGETMEDIMYRYQKMVDFGCHPYPMVYNNLNPELKRFQRWVIRRYHEFIPWADYGKKVADAAAGQVLGLLPLRESAVRQTTTELEEMRDTHQQEHDETT
ncbi:MAG: hypothetical protein O2821_12700 [Chloroflexi bacterium]|nr:hypothetical protein [Chloroflexota bacterium]